MEKDVRYLRRSPATKRRHIHSPNAFFSPIHVDSPPPLRRSAAFPALATCYLSRLERLREENLDFLLLDEMTLSPSTVQPATLLGISGMADYVCQVETAVNLSSNTGHGEHNVFARVHLTQFDKTSSQ